MTIGSRVFSMHHHGSVAVRVCALVAFCAFIAREVAVADNARPVEVPHYAVDTSWPRLPLPKSWTLGEIAGIAIDADDTVWIVQRAGTLHDWERAAAQVPPVASCCVPAPPVIQFDRSGRVLRAWGGQGAGYQWPASEHGIAVDRRGNVWIGGNGAGRSADGMVLKFTREGKFLMQIGHAGSSKGSADSTQLAGAADIAVYEPTSEVFIADGYRNNRVIVFDANTGEFKRMWGAYGLPPTDEHLLAYDSSAAPARQFRNVHCIKISHDGLVYVCDRDNNRVQVFRTDGTYVQEWFFERRTRADLGPGSVAHLDFWHDNRQSLLILADIPNSKVRFVRRADGVIVGDFGHFGNYAGQFSRLHQAVVDSHGTIYTAEAAGRRVQRFTNAGASFAQWQKDE